MSSKIFAAEINLDQVKSTHKAVFNETQIRAFIGGLSAVYDEVFILTKSNLSVFIVIGNTPAFLIGTLADLTSASGIKILSDQEAIALFIGIANGTHSVSLSTKEIRKTIQQAMELSIEPDCFGNILRALVEAALIANSRSEKRKEEIYYGSIISEPSVEVLDFSKISSN